MGRYNVSADTTSVPSTPVSHTTAGRAPRRQPAEERLGALHRRTPCPDQALEEARCIAGSASALGEYPLGHPATDSVTLRVPLNAGQRRDGGASLA